MVFKKLFTFFTVCCSIVRDLFYTRNTEEYHRTRYKKFYSKCRCWFQFLKKCPKSSKMKVWFRVFSFFSFFDRFRWHSEQKIFHSFFGDQKWIVVNQKIGETTLRRMALRRMMLSRMTLSRITLNRMTFSWMTSIRMTFRRLTLRKMTLQWH